MATSNDADARTDDNHADPRPFVLRYTSESINARAMQRFESRDAAESELADLRDADNEIRTDHTAPDPTIDFDPRY